MRIHAGILAIVGAFMALAAAHAHEGATGVVKERMDSMKTVARAMKAIKTEIAKGDAFDAGAIAENAGIVQRHSGEALVALFPEGSGHAPSEARPEVWSDRATFAELADDMSQLAATLKAEAQAGARPTQAFADLAGACGRCHKWFRE